MLLKQLINKSYYCTIGHIGKESDLELHERYILYNLPVLKEYKGHIVVTNYSGDFQEQNHTLWKKYFPDCIILDLEQNRGHSFGIADQENTIIDYCHNNNIKWICKSSFDVVFDSSILSIEIDESDFYYIDGFSFETLYNNNFDFNKLYTSHFFPQTNFYFLDTTKIDYIYDKKYVDETYNYIQNLDEYNGKVWEYIKGWECEGFLLSCVERNNLKKSHLISKGTYNELFNLIKNNRIGDPSHKNIMINGICHFHFPNQNVVQLKN